MMDPASIASMVTNPSNIDAITKILAKYQLMQSLGNAGEKWLTADREKEAMDKELMRLSIARERRMLGYEDSWDYNKDLNDGNGISAALGLAAMRRTPMPKRLGAEPLHPVWKEAQFVPTGDLPNAAKWITMAAEPIEEGASHGRNAILRAISAIRK